ncbi:MAG TPA: hypothetical protein PKD67_12655 [Ignavibacteriaceae bacterium]|nr:hypothetical protein [Ignavibacteriaceae bacterium]
MQLIEIVQLVLIGFVLLIIIIFFVSYLGYKTTKKNKNNSRDEIVTKINDDSESFNTIQSTKSIKKEEVKLNENAHQRFQVFNPAPVNKKTKDVKKHFPRTLFIKK